MVIEGLDLEVQLCAVLTMGVLEREAVIMFFTADSTAESAGCLHSGVYSIQSNHVPNTI